MDYIYFWTLNESVNITVHRCPCSTGGYSGWGKVGASGWGEEEEESVSRCLFVFWWSPPSSHQPSPLRSVQFYQSYLFALGVFNKHPRSAPPPYLWICPELFCSILSPSDHCIYSILVSITLKSIKFEFLNTWATSFKIISKKIKNDKRLKGEKLGGWRGRCTMRRADSNYLWNVTSTHTFTFLFIPSWLSFG